MFCRGLSLFGALLALALLGMIVLAASTFFETLAAERRARIAVQQLTVLADASASHVHGRFPELLAAARGGPVEITLAQLKGAGSLPADFSAVDALGRGYRVLILAAGADVIDVMATEAVGAGDTVHPFRPPCWRRPARHASAWSHPMPRPGWPDPPSIMT